MNELIHNVVDIKFENINKKLSDIENNINKLQNDMNTLLNNIQIIHNFIVKNNTTIIDIKTIDNKQ